MNGPARMQISTDPDRVRIVGLDSSLAEFGAAALGLSLAEWARNPRAKLVDAEVWATERNPHTEKKGEDLQLRIDYLTEKLIDFLTKHSPDLVFIEAAQIIRVGGVMTTARLWRVRGAVDGVCRSLCLPLYEFSPIKVKNLVTAFKRAPGQKRVKGDGPTKADVAAALRPLYLIEAAHQVNDNATDAIAVAHTGLFSEPFKWLVEQRRGENRGA